MLSTTINGEIVLNGKLRLTEKLKNNEQQINRIRTKTLYTCIL